jgi:hypothetical protein
MSSVKDPRSKAMTASEGWGEEVETQSSSLTDYKKTSVSTSKEDAGEAEGRGKAPSVNAAEGNHLAPAPLGNGSEPDAASVASITSQPERRTARTTRSRVQSMNGNDQLNGGKLFQEQVSTTPLSLPLSASYCSRFETRPQR